MVDRMNNIGLVLEGGGLRGIYTAGVLDAFLLNGIELNYCIGVSAGVCNALSYISKQKERSRNVNINYINDKRYFSIRNFITTGSMFGYRMLFDTIPNELLPFDYDSYKKSSCRLVAGATDCVTGEEVYYTLDSVRKQYDIINASISLPFISRIVKYDNKELLDGGLADPIPIKKSIADGNEKNIVVLTQHRGYQKTPSSLNNYAKIKYKRYPKLIEVLNERHNIYNDTLGNISILEEEKKVFAIYPSKPLEISRFEKDTNKLLDVYNLGLSDTLNSMDNLKEFIDK